MDLPTQDTTRYSRLCRPRRSVVDVLVRRILKGLGAGLVLTSSLGCQIGYYVHSAYHQSVLFNNRISIDRALRSSKLTDAQKSKLKLVQEVKVFAEQELGLKASSNYTTYVPLDGPYVTYIVQAAHAYELKPFHWKFPFVGEVPYKGYFSKSRADQEAATFAKDQFDTYVRGVTAYSTLGWFQDSVLSSMLGYQDYDLVEVIIHETVHTTLFIKNAAQFNERMATFLGEQGMRLFYRQKEGDHTNQIRQSNDDSHDRQLFSKFITKEVNDLKKWYETHRGQLKPEDKSARLKELQQRFTNELRPKLKTKSYQEFEKRELNNAFLLAYQTYEYSLDDFQKLFDKNGEDFKKTMAYLTTLKNTSQPDQVLKDYVASGSAPGE